MTSYPKQCRQEVRKRTIKEPQEKKKKNYHYQLKFLNPPKLSVRGGLQFIQSLSRVRLFATPWSAALQTPLSITNSQSLLRVGDVHRVGDAIQPSHPLSSPSLPAPNPSQHHSLFQ